MAAHAYPIGLVLLSAFVMMLEWAFPWRPTQKQLRRKLWSDVLHLVFEGHLLGLQVEYQFQDEHGDHAVGGVLLTATRIVNAIPAVCEASPGFLSALDLPLITGKGLFKP